MSDQSSLSVDPLDRVGSMIRSTHHYGYRCGEWGRVLGLRTVDDRICYMVAWNDEDSDLWPVSDPDDPYMFNNAAPSSVPPTPPAPDDNPATDKD